MALWWLHPRRSGALLGASGNADMRSAFLAAQGQAPLVELLEDSSSDFWPKLVMQEVVLGLLDELAHRVDLRPLQAVAGPLGKVQVLDGEIEVRRDEVDRPTSPNSRPWGASLMSATSPTSERSVSPAEASASRGEMDPSVVMSSTSRSKFVDCSTRVGSTAKATSRMGLKIESTG